MQVPRPRTHRITAPRATKTETNEKNCVKLERSLNSGFA